MHPPPNRRILLIDDNPAIHQDFAKILGGSGEEPSALEDVEAALFGDEPAGESAPVRAEAYELDSAFQGQEALAKLEAALARGRPYAMAFVDVRMPPGWDGVETIQRLWAVDPHLQAVICTAYSDYSWSEMIARLGQSDRLLILKKPFDSIEACQIANALTEKWSAALREREALEEARRAEQEAQAYAASLETVNRTLEAAMSAAEADSRSKSQRLVSMTEGVLEPASALVGGAERIRALEPPRGRLLDAVEELCREGGELRRTLEDVLDLSRLESGALALERRECALEPLAREVLAEFAALAAQKGSALAFERDGSAPERVATDPRIARKVLRHLVENAVCHGEPGTVRVRLDWRASATGQEPRAALTVIDTGPGIPRERWSSLFDSGLGLGLSRRLAHALGGSLELESSPGAGSRFTLVL
jgi:two-component system sensor histidine kinase/response regulator